MAELNKDRLELLLEKEEEEFNVETFRRKHGISPTSNMYVYLSRLVKEGKWKRTGRGIYRRIQAVKPVEWWEGGDAEPIPFLFPCTHEEGDYSLFDIDSMVEIFAGDMILIAGASNQGKTTMALSILGENLSNFKHARLMGSEYTAADGKISPKFKRRMERMEWAEWMKDGKPRFELLPVGGDYEDYVKPDALNVIDWISLSGEYYLIDQVMKSIKDRVGDGVAVVVIQKNKTNEFGEGGERTERYADVYIKIDPFGENESMLTLGKVKAPKGRATGRMWAFSIVDYGANFHNIREIDKCTNCWGKGYTKVGNENKRCQVCEGMKYVDKL